MAVQSTGESSALGNALRFRLPLDAGFKGIFGNLPWGKIREGPTAASPALERDLVETEHNVAIIDCLL